MSLTRKLYRAAYRANQADRALSNPARFARTRAKSKALGAVGFWSAMAKFWRS